MSLLHLVTVYWSIILCGVNSLVIVSLLWVIYGNAKDLSRAIKALSRICAAPVSARADSVYATEAQWMQAQARAALQGLGTKRQRQALEAAHEMLKERDEPKPPPPVAAGKDSQ